MGPIDYMLQAQEHASLSRSSMATSIRRCPVIGRDAPPVPDYVLMTALGALIYSTYAQPRWLLLLLMAIVWADVCL